MYIHRFSQKIFAKNMDASNNISGFDLFLLLSKTFQNL